MSPRSLLLAAAPLLLTACGPLTVEAQAQRVCQRLPRQVLEVPANLPAAVVATGQGLKWEKRFDFDISVEVPADWKSRVDHEVGFEGVTITALEPATGFDFVKSASVRLEPPPGSSLPAKTLTWTPDPAAESTITVRQAALDLAPYLDTGLLSYTVAVETTRVVPKVVLDVESCASVDVTVDWGLQQR